jgi:hypothetical protein
MPTPEQRWATRPTAPGGDPDRQRATTALGPGAERKDRGNATAELAVSLPALVLLVAAGLAGISAVRTQMECVDAARESARAVARGATAPPAPAGATVTVTMEGDSVRATVAIRANPIGGRLPGFDITATAVAAVEPGPEAP